MGYMRLHKNKAILKLWQVEHSNAELASLVLAAQCSPNYVGSQCVIVVNGSFRTIRSALFKFGAL